MNRKPTFRILIAVLAVALSLLLAVSALAAHPKAGKTYAGFTSELPFNGFKAPISFKVSSDGKKLLRFQWATTGCLGRGGPGNAFADPANIYKVATIKVSASGKFSVKNLKRTNAAPGQPPITTTQSVNGSFKTSKKASGTISIAQEQQGHHCSSKVTFTATTH
jgi:hypothetical protein